MNKKHWQQHYFEHNNDFECVATTFKRSYDYLPTLVGSLCTPPQVPSHQLAAEHRAAVADWDRLHFRSSPESSSRRPYSTSTSTTPTDRCTPPLTTSACRILKRLESYEPRLPPPPLRPQPPPLPRLAIDDTLLPSLQQVCFYTCAFTCTSTCTCTCTCTRTCTCT